MSVIDNFISQCNLLPPTTLQQSPREGRKIAGMKFAERVSGLSYRRRGDSPISTPSAEVNCAQKTRCSDGFRFATAPDEENLGAHWIDHECDGADCAGGILVADFCPAMRSTGRRWPAAPSGSGSSPPCSCALPRRSPTPSFRSSIPAPARPTSSRSKPSSRRPTRIASPASPNISSAGPVTSITGCIRA